MKPKDLDIWTDEVASELDITVLQRVMNEAAVKAGRPVPFPDALNDHVADQLVESNDVYEHKGGRPGKPQFTGHDTAPGLASAPETLSSPGDKE